MRVAVSQFATSSNVQKNLATCVRMINEAAVCKPSLIVLPEYCNTLFCNRELGNAQPCYVDHNQAWQEALSINGSFLQSIAEQAKKHHCYIVINVTLQRDALRDHQDGSIKSNIKSSTKSNISVTSCLFSPLGKLIQQVDKQTLIGHENDFFISGSNVSAVVTTPFASLGLLTGNDDITFEASRDLALGGAQLLCHSMNTFALDQSSLYGPARACENKVFLVSANKVGSLIPKALPEEMPAEKTQEYLAGVGQSQIVSPDGKVLAKITNNKEGFVFADIDLADLAECNINNKCRPDGTELIKQRRPELYQRLTPSIKQAPEHLHEHAHEDALDNSTSINNNPNSINNENNNVPVTANVAIFATYKSNEQAIEDVCHYIENNLSDIIQLPELFFLADKTITNDAQQLAQIACLSKQLIAQISSVLRPFQYVCTSLVIEGMHQAVLISEHGLLATQQQLHFCQRYQWTALGDEVKIIDLPLEQGNISLAMLTADDANIAEIVNVAALNNIHLLLVPFDIQEPCEVDFSLLSRATENRICIVAASREKNFANDLPRHLPADNASNNSQINTKNKNKVKVQKSTGLIINLTTNIALSAPWKPRKFDGYINPPVVKQQHGKITKAVIHPIAACSNY